MCKGDSFVRSIDDNMAPPNDVITGQTVPDAVNGDIDIDCDDEHGEINRIEKPVFQLVNLTLSPNRSVFGSIPLRSCCASFHYIFGTSTTFVKKGLEEDLKSEHNLKQASQEL